MRAEPFHELLSGADRRSIGKSNQAVARVLRRPRGFRALIRCLWSENLVVRMRAADAVEKVSVHRPDLLIPFKSELLGLADEASQPELRWHFALMLPRLPLDLSERDRAIATLRQYLGDRSSIVKTMAIQGLFDLAQAHPASRSELSGLLEECCRAGTPAMRARSRKLLARLSAKNKSSRKSLSAGARRKKGL